MNFHQPTETGKPAYDPLVDSFELLMKMYPEEHPANLHGVMCVTNNNIVETMKILQYYRNYREKSKEQLERSASTYLPPSMTSTYVPQASTIPSMSTYKTEHSMSANEVQFPTSWDTDQLSASMYAYKTEFTQVTNTSQQPACMYPYKSLLTMSAHEAQTPTSTNAGQLPVSMHEPERFMYKYEPELSRSLYQTSVPTSQHACSLFDQPYSMSSDEKQFYNTTYTSTKSSVFPHDLYNFTPLSDSQLCCTSLSEAQSSLPVFDPQYSMSSTDMQHSSSGSDASESQPITTTFDTSFTSTDLNTTSTGFNTTSTDLNTTSTVESGSLEHGYAVSNSSSDDDDREYVVLVPVDDQEMELTPSGVVPPAYRMTSIYRGRNGQYIKKLD